jgi:CelD/BcsL family acetyltransferase involved in cellulose biosynthesis
VGEWDLLKLVWNQIVASKSEDIHGLDVTATFEWAAILRSTRLEAARARLLYAEESDRIVGLLPLYESGDSRHRLKFKKLSPITELYSGRCGLILNDYRPEYLTAFIDYIYSEVRGWNAFEVTVVDDSCSAALLEEICETTGLRYSRERGEVSPYIELERSWEDYFNSLAKKFRWNLRNGRKKLEGLGPLQYIVYEKADEVEAFLASVMEIERASWKETAGTSITSKDYQEAFYKGFCAAALDRGWFCGHVLEVSGKPVAYIYGVVYGGVFYDFKESYKGKYREFSPGHVLKTYVFEELFRRGIKTYDFMGSCEDYKLRWTDRTYSRSKYILYNKNVIGTTLWGAGRVARYARAYKVMRPSLTNG